MEWATQECEPAGAVGGTAAPAGSETDAAVGACQPNRLSARHSRSLCFHSSCNHALSAPPTPLVQLGGRQDPGPVDAKDGLSVQARRWLPQPVSRVCVYWRCSHARNRLCFQFSSPFCQRAHTTLSLSSIRHAYTDPVPWPSFRARHMSFATTLSTLTATCAAPRSSRRS